MTATVATLLKEGARSLARRSDSPRLDAELLLGKLLGMSRAGLHARGEDRLDSRHEHDFASLIGRRAAGTPVAYLTGSREFWSLALEVTPDVLVPRPETERLVELALGVMPADEPIEVLDLGTGSGAIALAIASERPRARITAIDVSPRALEVAAANGRRLSLENIVWRTSDWYAALGDERFAVILGNPPYIAAGDPALAALTAEPLLALASGCDGLDALSAIAAGAHAHLNPGGMLLLEHGADQAPAVADLLKHHGFTDILNFTDLSGKPRVTRACLHHHKEST